MANVILSVMHEPPVPISRFLPGISPWVDGLFEAALAKSRPARPSDAGAWAGSLATLLESQELDAGQGWPAQRWEDRALSTRVDPQAPTGGSGLSAETH